MQFQIELEDFEQANIIMKSLKPELNSSPKERATAQINLKNEGILDIRIKASDATALRAAVNSYLRWIMLSLDVIKLRNL
jgi:KEOPS complex subunit Pcc1